MRNTLNFDWINGTEDVIFLVGSSSESSLNSSWAVSDTDDAELEAGEVI